MTTANEWLCPWPAPALGNVLFPICSCFFTLETQGAREQAGKPVTASGGGAEKQRETHTESENRPQGLSCGHRARRRAGTQEPRGRALSPSRKLNPLNHPGARGRFHSGGHSIHPRPFPQGQSPYDTHTTRKDAIQLSTTCPLSSKEAALTICSKEGALIKRPTDKGHACLPLGPDDSPGSPCSALCPMGNVVALGSKVPCS